MKPAKPAGERENTAALTPSLGTRSDETPAFGQPVKKFVASWKSVAVTFPFGATPLDHQLVHEQRSLSKVYEKTEPSPARASDTSSTKDVS